MSMFRRPTNGAATPTGNRTPNVKSFRMSNVLPPSAVKNGAQHGRMSVAYNEVPSSVRRQSIFKPQAFKDTRPITNKEFQATMQRKISKYMQEDCQMVDITEKTVRSPTKSEFVVMFECIYQHMDSTFTLSPKIDAEIPDIFRRLGYPVPLKPSTIQTIGAAHSWPNLLAALTWLIDFVEMIRCINPSEVLLDDEQGDGHTKAISYAFYQNAFSEHYSRGEALTEEYVDKHINRFRHSLEEHGQYDNQLKEMNAANDMLTQEIACMTAERGQEEILKKEVASLQADIRTQTDYLKQLEHSASEFSRAFQTASDNMETAEKHMKELMKSVEDKEATIRNQNTTHGLSPEEARSLMRKINTNRAQLAAMQSEMEVMGRDVWRERPRVQQILEQETSHFKELVRKMLQLKSSLMTVNDKTDPVPNPRNAKELQTAVVEYGKNEANLIFESIEKAKKDTQVAIDNVRNQTEELRLRCQSLTERMGAMCREEQREERQRNRDKEAWGHSKTEAETEVETLEKEVEQLAEKKSELRRVLHDIQMEQTRYNEEKKKNVVLKHEFTTRLEQKLDPVIKFSENMKKKKQMMLDSLRIVHSSLQDVTNCQRKALKIDEREGKEN